MNYPCNLFQFYDIQIYHPIPPRFILSVFDFQSMETSTRAIRSLVPRSEAEEVMKTIIEDKSSGYQCISFMKFRSSHQVSLVKSKQYENYQVLCHENTLYHAGLMLCSYITGQRNVPH